MRTLFVIAALAACGGTPAKQTTTTGSGTGTGTGTGTGSEVTAAAVQWPDTVRWDQVPEPGPEPEYRPPAPVTFTLENGVRVVLVENRRLPLVSVRVVHTRAGAREDGKKVGLAALTADLIDEGAGALDALALPEAVEQLGARLDTGIAEDAALVSLDTLATTLEGSLALLADVVLRPRFEAKDFERVKGDTLEDLKLRPQEPRRVAALVFDRVILGNHAYAQPPAGYVSTVEKLTLGDVKAFWKRAYVPQETTIVVAGDVDRATLEPALASAFGAWKGKKPAPPKLGGPGKPRTPTIAFVDRPAAPQSVLMIGRPGPSTKDPSLLVADVVNTATGGSFASRLNARLREELGYTYGARSSYWRGRYGGTWTVSTSVRTDVTLPAIKEALAIVERGRTEELPAAELEKAQQLMTRQLPQDFETNAGIAGQLAGLVIGGLPLDWHQGYVAGVRGVTAADAKATAAAQWSDLTIVVVGDWAAIGDDLGTLGLPIERYDAEGNLVK